MIRTFFNILLNMFLLFISNKIFYLPFFLLSTSNICTVNNLKGGDATTASRYFNPYLLHQHPNFSKKISSLLHTQKCTFTYLQLHFLVNIAINQLFHTFSNTSTLRLEGLRQESSSFYYMVIYSFGMCIYSVINVLVIITSPPLKISYVIIPRPLHPHFNDIVINI